MASLMRSSSTDGRNSCSGGSSSRTVTGRPSMASRIATKSCFWAARSSSRAAASSSAAGGEDHAPHDRQPVVGQEHVLGAAQPDPLRPEASGVGRVGTVVGVGPHGQMPLADLVGPTEDHVELWRRFGRTQFGLAQHHPPGAAVDRDHVALVEP